MIWEKIYNDFWDSLLGKSDESLYPRSPSMYENWHKLFEDNETGKAVTKEELDKYFSDIKRKTKQIPSRYHGAGKMFKCWNCKYARNIEKNGISLAGNIRYVLTCKREKVTVFADWDSHISDLPCFRDLPCFKEMYKKKTCLGQELKKYWINYYK